MKFLNKDIRCLKRLGENCSLNVGRMKAHAKSLLNGVNMLSYWQKFYQKQMEVYLKLDTETLKYLLTEKALDYDVNLSFSWLKKLFGAGLSTLFIEFINWSKWISRSTLLENFPTGKCDFLIFMTCSD